VTIAAGDALAVLVQESGTGTPLAISVTWSVRVQE